VKATKRLSRRDRGGGAEILALARGYPGSGIAFLQADGNLVRGHLRDNADGLVDLTSCQAGNDR